MAVDECCAVEVVADFIRVATRCCLHAVDDFGEGGREQPVPVLRLYGSSGDREVVAFVENLSRVHDIGGKTVDIADGLVHKGIDSHLVVVFYLHHEAVVQERHLHSGVEGVRLFPF